MGSVLYLERSSAGDMTAELVELRRRSANQIMSVAKVAEDESFYTEQHSLRARSAEQYARSTFDSEASPVEPTTPAVALSKHSQPALISCVRSHRKSPLE